MTNSKHIAGLDEVLADYAQASEDFDAKVLQAFVAKYPEHAAALHRYAHIQLTSVPASAEEVNREVVTDEELLPLQSKFLQSLQQLRGTSPDMQVDQAMQRLSEIAGSDAADAATLAVFGASEHGEDILFLTVTEAVSAIPSFGVVVVIASPGTFMLSQRALSPSRSVNTFGRLSPLINWSASGLELHISYSTSVNTSL